MRTFLLLFLFVLAGCSDREHSTFSYFQREAGLLNDKMIVLIQPFGKISKEKIELIKTEIEGFYNCGEVRVANALDLPAMAWYEPRKRYVADSLLVYLKNNKPANVDYVIGLTDKDIATRKGEIENYGIMGLGFCPGNFCVVSTFRVKSKVKNVQHFNERFVKVCLHELGHNFGLPHCNENDSCFMNDADGTVKSVDREKKWLCESCRKKINNYIK